MRQFSYLIRYTWFRLNGRVIHLHPHGAKKGAVLLAYTTLPWIDTRPIVLSSHTNRWECMTIAQAYLDRGYAVDVIDWDDQKFLPRKKYAYVIDIHNTIDRIQASLASDTFKVMHLTSAHWLYQNEAEYCRLLQTQARRGVTLLPRRIVLPSRSFDMADAATILGNNFTRETYAYRSTPLYRIPISTTHEFPYPEGKPIDEARTRFLWFGGSGSVHKGLDITLEAFVRMPEFELIVCGKVDPDFAEVYRTELQDTKNIHLRGWVDPGSSEFEGIRQSCIGLIHPSCSEGGGGSVILGMHAGLIPIVSRQSSVDIADFGVELSALSSAAIQDAVRSVAAASLEDLQRRSRGAWSYAREHHTRETFAHGLKAALAQLERMRDERVLNSRP